MHVFRLWLWLYDLGFLAVGVVIAGIFFYELQLAFKSHHEFMLLGLTFLAVPNTTIICEVALLTFCSMTSVYGVVHYEEDPLGEWQPPESGHLWTLSGRLQTLPDTSGRFLV